MTTPFTYTGRLARKAKQLGVDLQKANDQEKLALYYETVVGIRDQLYKQKLSILVRTPKFLETLESDLGQITLAIRLLIEKKFYVRELRAVKGYVDKAYGRVSRAVNLFDDNEEIEGVKRIDGRTDALLDVRDFLDEAILQWPG